MIKLPSYYYVTITLLDWTLSCFAAPRPSPSLIQITCVIFTDDLWRRKIKKTNCVGGCRCGLWYCVLVKEHVKGKKKTSAPTLVLFERCHSFKDWCLQTLQKCNAAPWQPASHSLNVNKREIRQGPALEYMLINKMISYTGQLNCNCTCVQKLFCFFFFFLFFLFFFTFIHW